MRSCSSFALVFVAFCCGCGSAAPPGDAGSDRSNRRGGDGRSNGVEMEPGEAKAAATSRQDARAETRDWKVSGSASRGATKLTAEWVGAFWDADKRRLELGFLDAPPSPTMRKVFAKHHGLVVAPGQGRALKVVLTFDPDAPPAAGTVNRYSATFANFANAPFSINPPVEPGDGVELSGTIEAGETIKGRVRGSATFGNGSGAVTSAWDIEFEVVVR